MSKFKEFIKYRKDIFALKELLNLIITFTKLLQQTKDYNDKVVVYHLKALNNRYFELKQLIKL